ncbi:Lipoate-protein ligase A [Halomicrobium zhouii]|uniref:Lipoate-protein ligase A n=1 Tax=Halomicrobium zhouii TaxID=767519 RepID=A0A1I6L5U3_9EURY|nr:lipoate--protein ligase family protein [Halomicrobium zhouii]SFR98802.1 Lipoate-protein ligase A [Halomicrobium zhouii]
MRLLRGRASDPETDQRRTREMVDAVADSDAPALRVWTPSRQVVFGRRDRRSDGYERARELVLQRDFAVREREVGGRAVAYTGTTVAFALAEPVDDHRRGIGARYDRALDALQSALADRGISAERGEPPDSFCPGSHSLQTDDGKVAGVAQRVRQDVAVVAGVVVVSDAATVADVLDPVYDALGVPFDPANVGSLAAATDGEPTPERVVDAVGRAFTGESETGSDAVRGR